MMSLFVDCGNKVFRQLVGILMELHRAPHIVDSFVCCNQSPFITNNRKDCCTCSLISLFMNISQYLDDIVTVNNFIPGVVCKTN